MSKPFKMKGFSGFGNSPIKQSPPAPSEPRDGALPGEVETGLEEAKRGLGLRGNVVDILRRRKGDKRPPSAEKQKRMTEYSAKHGHRRPNPWEQIKSDLTGGFTKKKSPTKQKSILPKDNKAVQKMKLEQAKVKAINRLKKSGE